MNLKTRTVMLALNDSCKQFFLAVTSVASALGVFGRDALYKLRFTYLLTYLLTMGPAEQLHISPD